MKRRKTYGKHSSNVRRPKARRASKNGKLNKKKVAIVLGIIFIIFSLIIIAAIIVIFRKELAMLDVLTLGKEQAVNLGVDYDRCIRRLLLAVTLCISVATAMVGPISFLGLIIANLSRQMLKTYRHTQLILGSALFGMIGLIFGQLIVERIFVYAIPVSVFITVGGGIYFLYLLLAGKRA